MLQRDASPADCDFIRESADLYRRTLLDDIVPFWLRHGFDRTNGGISNILDDAGNVVGTDKYMWSQGRALWTFSALCNRVERRAEWLEFANHLFEYIRTHGRNDRGHWVFRLDAQGRVLDDDISIYVDGFVLAGLTEYYAATGNEQAMSLALETYEQTSKRIARPGSYGVAPYLLPPGLKTHGLNMCFGLFYFELGQVACRNDIRDAGVALAREILDDFYVPEKDAILEFVTTDGRPVDSPEGRACVPGHAIESLWFQIWIFERTGDVERIRECCRLIRRHLELAWDPEFGGLRLALDINGVEPPYWNHAACKPWWVQAESLVATGYAYAHTGEQWCLDWHARVQRFCFAHYPVSTGEWTPWVDHQNRPMRNPVLPVKDPFHLPRAMIHLIDLFGKQIPEKPAWNASP